MTPEEQIQDLANRLEAGEVVTIPRGAIRRLVKRELERRGRVHG